MDAGQIIVIGLSLALVLWLVGGVWYNRRRRREIWYWLEAGLDVFGGRVSTAWIGSSGAGLRVAIDKPLAPFQRIELVVRLLSRENLPLWLFELAQGKQDQFAFRGWLRSPGRGEIEVVPVDSVLDRALQAQDDAPWQRVSVSKWAISQRGNVKDEQVVALREFIAAYDGQLGRFSRRRSQPHLFVQMSLDKLMEGPSRQLLSQIKSTVTT